MRKLTLTGALLGVVVVLSLTASKDGAKPSPTPPTKATPTRTPTTTTLTPTTTRTPTPTAAQSATPTSAVSATATVTLTASPTAGVPTVPPGGVVAYPGAPLCPDSNGAHEMSIFHTLWDGVRGCHYDHEHGTNPFTSEVTAAFPGFDLRALLGGVEVGHTNPSSPMENTMKHGGMKWGVQLAHPQGCSGFEGATNGVNGSVIEYHNFGDYEIELEASHHTTASLLRLCNSANPTDYGYIYTVQLQTYGQVVVPYQGTVFTYPYYEVPPYPSPRGQYLSVDCIGPVIQCRSSRELVLSRGLSASSNWTSKITGSGARPQGSTLFTLLFRIGDIYRLYDWSDQTHPFTFIWLCSSDGGATYNPAGCRYNNSRTQVHEISGVIPAAWDNLAGFDTDPRVGRITAEGFTTRFGQRNAACAAPGPDCHPIKMESAFVGTYGSVLVFTPNKGTNIVPFMPERDVYFCGGQVCSETSPGAVASGWIGPGN
jgi:hypothetical protein